MAILRPSKSFEGGDLTQKGSSYIKPNTRVIDFRNKDNGVFLFLLGAYKLDSLGNGVWYRPLRIRDNFGTGYKEKFPVQPNCPIDYFENRVRGFAPEMAKSKKVQDENGRDRTIYPVWGRGTGMRVLYNAALFNDLAAGVHVLDIPQYGGASVIDEYVRGRDADGVENPTLNDYQAAIPLNIKLDLKAQGQPWKIQINNSKKYSLPEQLADADYLYNLDEIVVYPEKEALIEKLRSLIPSDIFAKGMEGYSAGPTQVSFAATSSISNSVTSWPNMAAEEDNVDTSPSGPSSPPVFENPVAARVPNKSLAPTLNMPKANSTPAISALSNVPSMPESSVANVRADVMAAAAAFLKNNKKS